MLLKKIILRNSEKFESSVKKWSDSQKISVVIFDGQLSLLEVVDSLVILHADHNISKENEDMRSLLKKNNKPTHQVDINATINASVSSFRFWLENNSPQNVLFIGDDSLAESQRLSNYLNKLSDNLKAS